MTPTKRNSLDLEPGCSVAGEPLSCGGHWPRRYSFRRPLFSPHPAGFAFRFCPAFFSSVALGKMSLDASVKPTTSPSRTLNHALRLRPAIPQKVPSPAARPRSRWSNLDLSEASNKALKHENQPSSDRQRARVTRKPGSQTRFHGRKALSSSCLRCIAVVSLKLPPESLPTVTATRHQAAHGGGPNTHGHGFRGHARPSWPQTAVPSLHYLANGGATDRLPISRSRTV